MIWISPDSSDDGLERSREVLQGDVTVAASLIQGVLRAHACVH